MIVWGAMYDSVGAMYDSVGGLCMIVWGGYV